MNMSRIFVRTPTRVAGWSPVVRCDVSPVARCEMSPLYWSNFGRTYEETYDYDFTEIRTPITVTKDVRVGSLSDATASTVVMSDATASTVVMCTSNDAFYTPGNTPETGSPPPA